jgi:hypothetical protein
MNRVKASWADGVLLRTYDFRSPDPDHDPPRRLERYHQQRPGGL